jgi:hypothetical protein
MAAYANIVKEGDQLGTLSVSEGQFFIAPESSSLVQDL